MTRAEVEKLLDLVTLAARLHGREDCFRRLVHMILGPVLEELIPPAAEVARAAHRAPMRADDFGFGSVDVGESFIVIADKDDRKRLGKMCFEVGRRLGRKFSLRRIEAGYRIHRLE